MLFSLDYKGIASDYDSNSDFYCKTFIARRRLIPNVFAFALLLLSFDESKKDVS